MCPPQDCEVGRRLVGSELPGGPCISATSKGIAVYSGHGNRVNTAAQLLTDVIFSASTAELKGHSQERRTPMRRSQSNEPLEQGSASTQTPGDPQTSEFHLGTVIDAIPGFVWSALPDGEVEFCNQRWLDYTGMSLDEARGEELTSAIHPQDKSDFVEKWRAALAQGESFEAEARMRRADACYRWFLIRAVPLREANGGINRWYGTNIDIEDLKRAQEEVLKQTSRLDELFEQTPEAVAVLSADGRIV